MLLTWIQCMLIYYFNPVCSKNPNNSLLPCLFVLYKDRKPVSQVSFEGIRKKATYPVRTFSINLLWYTSFLKTPLRCRKNN